VRRGREDPHHFGERFGHAGTPRPAGPLVWVHGASVGESMSTLAVLKHLRTMRPGLNILLTTGTRTGHAMLEKLVPALPGHGTTVIQYAPLDFTTTVARFMAHWQPTLSVFVESDFWPNLLSAAPRPVLLNGRISDRSWKRYRKYRWFFRPLLSRFEAALAQRNTDAQRLRKMGAKNVHVAGNLKFDAEPLPADAAALEKLHTAIGKRPVLVFASTHPGEETLAAEVHATLKPSVPELLTIIIPRHPHRGTQAMGDVQRYAKYIARRGLGELPTGSPRPTEIYIADTLGELGLFYRLASVTVVGGSLVPHGGHNPLEPLKLGTPTLAGPHMFNFKDMLPALTESGALKVAKSVPDLTKQLHTLLTDSAAHKAHKALITATMPKLAGASRTAAALLAAQLPAR
jgi:3-deoxy-D-manno-octulosonic-acid transferase